MEEKSIYRVVAEWVREDMEMDGAEPDYQTVLSMAICDIDMAIELDYRDYGILPEESRKNAYKSLGATHMCRILVEGSCDLVDGWDIPFHISEGVVVEVENSGEPSYVGGELDEGMLWVAKRATKYCITE